MYMASDIYIDHHFLQGQGKKGPLNGFGMCLEVEAPAPRYIEILGVIEMKDKQERNWSFTSEHTLDVDWNMIAASTSKKDPIAFVVDGYRHYVIVHRSLLDKMHNVVNPSTMPEYLPESLVRLRDAARFEMDEVNDRAVWVDWAKFIKASSWKANGKRKAVIRVALPKI
jgi:hypothetical protein